MQRWVIRPVIADVDAVLAELLAGVRGTLGPQLVGVYLDGSLAAGEFSEHSSDIDLLVVTEDALSDEVVAALEEHDRAWVIHRHVVREHGVA